MGGPRKILRGLQDVRTLSGRVDKSSDPYLGYMKVSCLEMEKFRRGKERASALHRVQSIDARFREIEAEKAALLQALGGNSGAGGEQKPAPRQNNGRFKIRY